MLTAIGLALAGLLAGCAREPEAVFVDLSRVPLPERRPALPEVPKAPRPKVGSVTATIPAIPSQELLLGANEKRLQAVLDEVARNRRNTEAAVRKRLERAYLADVQRARAARRQELEPKHEALLDEVYAGLREVFESYANRRFRPQVELALRAGWPDPDPESVRKAPEPVVELRKQLAELDAGYRRERDARLAAAYEIIDTELSSLAAEMARLESEALDRATREAVARARTTEVEALAKSPMRKNVLLPALPEETVTTRAPDPPIEAPKLVTPDFRDVDRALLESELRIFLAHRGYRFAPKGARARDATQEFIEWRKPFQSGR